MTTPLPADIHARVTLLRKFGLHASADRLVERNGTCRGCRHLESDPREHPCATCRAFDKWEEIK